jgi:hypothetical protein
LNDDLTRQVELGGEMPKRITATAATPVATKPEPGHDAWVVENETFQGLEFESKRAETYAT